MSTAQRVVKNLFSLIFSGIITQLIDFIAVVYLARILGPADFGKINFAVAIIAYFTLLVNFGLPLLGAREIARNKEKINEYTGNILMLRLCLAILSLGLLLLMSVFLDKPPDIKYLLLLYGLGLLPSVLILDWVFQGVEKMEYIGFGRILAAAVYAGLVLMFIKSPEQLLLIPCFQVAGSLFASILFISAFVRNFGRPELKLNLISWQSLMRQALPLGISIIMIQVIYNIDTVMLGFMRSEAEIGYYNASYKIILLLIMTGAVYFDAIFPITSIYYKTSLDSLKKLQSYTARLMVTLAFPLAAGGTILAKPLMNLFYGVKYEEGITAFQILIWAAALIYINMIYARGMWACNRQDAYLKIVSIQAAVNILLNFILIPQMGITGAAISTVFSEFIGFLFYYHEFNKVVQVPIYNYVLRPIIATVIMSLFLKLGLELNIIFVIPAGAAIYAVSLYLIKGITRDDLSLVQNIFRGYPIKS